MISISPSSLDTHCARFHWLNGRKKPGETLPDESSHYGQEVERLVVDAIKQKQSEMVLDGKTVPIPTELLQYDAEFQKEIVYALDIAARIHGYIDILFHLPDGKIWIVDIKSSYSTAGASTNWKYQMGAYALRFLESPSDELPRVSIFFARHGLLEDIDLPQPSTIAARIQEVSDIIRLEEEPRPQPSGYCYLCQYAMSCPGVPEVVKASPEDLLQQYLVLSAKVEAIRKALSAYTAVNGTLELPDATIGHFPVESLEVTPEFWEWTKEQGLDPLTLCNPDKRKIMSLAKKAPECANYIVLSSEKTRFDIKVNRRRRKGNDDNEA